MKIDLDSTTLKSGDQVLKGRTTYTVVRTLPLGDDVDVYLRDPKGRIFPVMGIELEARYARTGNTTHPKAKRGAR